MRFYRFSNACLWLALGAPLHMALAQPAADVPLVLLGGVYLDVRAGGLRPNGAILVRGDTISEIVPPGQAWDPPADARVLPMHGRTIMPGLIDAHVHLTLAGKPDENARATVRAGFTTVIDLGSANGAGARLRDAIAQGRVEGPRVIAAGSWIGARGGVCEFGGATVANVREARERASADLDSGASILKVCVTGWPADAVASPDLVELGPDEITAVMGIAGARPVYAHAIGRAGALLAATLGARALAHTPIIDSVAAVALRTAGVVVISTLATLTAGPESHELRRSLRTLHMLGVPIVLGTDAGVLPHGENTRELIALTDAGLSPLEALRAATINAAALLGSRSVGDIAVGAHADFVVVRGDPLRDIRVVERPELVVQGGRVIKLDGNW